MTTPTSVMANPTSIKAQAATEARRRPFVHPSVLEMMAREDWSQDRVDAYMETAR